MQMPNQPSMGRHLIDPEWKVISRKLLSKKLARRCVEPGQVVCLTSFHVGDVKHERMLAGHDERVRFQPCDMLSKIMTIQKKDVRSCLVITKNWQL